MRDFDDIACQPRRNTEAAADQARAAERHQIAGICITQADGRPARRRLSPDGEDQNIRLGRLECIGQQRGLLIDDIGNCLTETERAGWQDGRSSLDADQEVASGSIAAAHDDLIDAG